MPSKEVQSADKKPENRKSLLATPRPSHAILPPDGPIPVPARKIKVHVANRHTKTLGVKPAISRIGSCEEPRIHDNIRKDKDPKSFTQNLFDTVASKLLHRANASSCHAPWAPSNETAPLVGSSNLDMNVLEPKIDGEISKKAEKETEKPLTTDTEFTGAAHDYNPTQIDFVPDVASVESKTTSSDIGSVGGMIQGSPSLGKGWESLETSGNDGKSDLAVNIEAEKSTLGIAILPSKVSQPDSLLEGLDVAGTTPLQKTSVSAAGRSEPTTDFPAQSLSHFTSANIIALRELRDVCHASLYEQHWWLKFLGRTDLPQHSSKCSSYGDFLAYSGQSMTYILSNVDALLQSFLHHEDSNACSKTVRPYDFPLIVDLFRKLRRIDMHPQKIFPSLWISVSRLYPVSAATIKRRPLTASDLDSFSFDPQPTSQGRSLNDLEACHVVKIILAALVASVPKWSPMSWIAVRKLHASGQVSPFVDADISRAEQKVIGKLVKTLHAFENEMALGLVIRLTRSIDLRYHLARARALAEDTEKSRRQYPPTFSRVLDYVNADSLKISVADNQGQPSVRCREWIDPEIASITWHPKEWPIIVEWLRAVILKEWDGKARIAKGSAVGGALGLMLHIRKQSNFHLSPCSLGSYENQMSMPPPYALTGTYFTRLSYRNGSMC